MPKAASTTRNPRTKSLKRLSGRASARSCDIQRIPLDQIHPSPENDQLYQPVDPNDPEVQALADSIREYGVREPLVITRDGFILSGHRRFAAARLAGLDVVPCRVEPLARDDDADQFVRLLREYNRQRVKTLAEQLREEVVSMNPEAAHIELLRHRIQKSDLSGFGDGTAIDPGDRRGRCGISNAKFPMLQTVLRVLEDRQKFWPLSDRSIHYALLNAPPLRHASKPESTYANDRASYQDLTDLLTRARLAGLIPWSAIGDETRPVLLWQADSTVQLFVRRELDGFLVGYWRDYQQSQINHIEIVAEKLSVRQIIEPVAQEFCLPLTIGRGYCSIMPRREMAERFRRSGREQLVIIMLTDFDPDGECIAESFVRSMRDDFSIAEVVAIKAALTREQVDRFELPPQMKAKAGSACYASFTDKHGDDVYELEALAPVDLQEALRASVRSVLDIEAFEHELMHEQADAAFLEGVRRQSRAALSSLLTSDRKPPPV
jgi:hypothetical protein